jgi:integrase/recombinase XerD
MSTQISILFMAIASRANANGELPVYCRLTLAKRQRRFMIGCTIPLNMWDQAKQRARGTTAKAIAVNTNIHSISKQIFKAESELLKQGEPFEVEEIMLLVQGKERSTYKTLNQLYEYRFKQMKKLEGIDYAKSTIRKFVELAATVKCFVQQEFNAEDIALSKINNQFIHRLEAWLKTERNMKQVSANKVIQKLKSVVSRAVDYGWLASNPFPGHRFKHERISVVYLTIDELEQLENYSFAQQRLVRVRDIFLFSVYTGLHYLDAMSLTRSNIIKGVDGKEWIKYLRQKTGKWIHIPLLQKAKNLIEKYSTENSQSGYLVPRISNQKMNSYLKEVADIAGIKVNLTHKIARKTFGSLLLYYDVPMKVVSELLGHSSVVITERHYAQVELKKIGGEMSKVDVVLST